MKRFEDLTLADNFIFFKVMQEPDICRRLLEVILNIEIDHIEYLEGEKTFDARYEAKSIRLDVYVKDGKASDEFTERLVEAVDIAKKNPKLRVEYMSYYANQRDLYLKAHDKGVEEGKNEGIAIGKAEGLEEGIRALIETSRELGSPYEETLRRAVQKFHLTEETAEAYMQKYWILSRQPSQRLAPE